VYRCNNVEVESIHEVHKIIWCRHGSLPLVSYAVLAQQPLDAPQATLLIIGTGRRMQGQTRPVCEPSVPMTTSLNVWMRWLVLCSMPRVSGTAAICSRCLSHSCPCCAFTFGALVLIACECVCCRPGSQLRMFVELVLDGGDPTRIQWLVPVFHCCLYGVFCFPSSVMFGVAMCGVGVRRSCVGCGRRG
jgi:hypothetical protein